MARTTARTARRFATAAAVLGAALTGALFLAPVSKAVAAERVATLTPPAAPEQLAPPATIPEITVTTLGPLDPRPEDPELTACPPVLSRSPNHCPPPPRPPCDANGDGKLDKADWRYLRTHPDACRPKPPCDANGDGKLDKADLLWLRDHPDACRPPKPPCDADGNGRLDQADWRYLREHPDACRPPDTSFRPPTRIDTGGGGTADAGLNFGELALLGAVLAGLVGGLATIPRRRWSNGSAR